MWCGPDAVARVTGWTREQVWLHVRWYRERRGSTLPNPVPKGGTHVPELLSAVVRAGFRVTTQSPILNLTPDDWEVRIGGTGCWLVLVRKHFCVYDGGEWYNRVGGRRVVQAWRVEWPT